MPGQMGLTGRIGTMLASIAARDDVKRCIEIGTWNGQGSTYCIACALAGSGGSVTSIEADAERYAEAVEFYRGRNLPVALLHGLTILPEEYRPYEAFEPLIAQADYEREAPGTHRMWYERELQMAASAPRTNLLRELVGSGARYDLALLDGGEFASSVEFDILEPAIDGWVVLDDTNPRMSIKNADNRRRLLESSAWEVVVDEPDDRCGWMVAKRRR